MSFATDTFTDAAGVDLTAHTADSGGPWTEHPAFVTGDVVIDLANRARNNSANPMIAYAAGAPATADYDVTADCVVLTTANCRVGTAGRIDTVNDTGYNAGHIKSPTNNRWELEKRIATVVTVLGTFDDALVGGNTKTVNLHMSGSTIELWVDGTVQVSVTDSDIAAAGKAGIRLTGSVADGTGKHLDNFAATDGTPAATTTQTGSGWTSIKKQRRRKALAQLLVAQIRSGRYE